MNGKCTDFWLTDVSIERELSLLDVRGCHNTCSDGPHWDGLVISRLTDWHLDSWFTQTQARMNMINGPAANQGRCKNADYKPVSLNSQHNRWSCYSWWKASIPIMSQSNTKLFCSNMFWWILFCDPFTEKSFHWPFVWRNILSLVRDIYASRRLSWHN